MALEHLRGTCRPLCSVVFSRKRLHAILEAQLFPTQNFSPPRTHAGPIQDPPISATSHHVGPLGLAALVGRPDGLPQARRPDLRRDGVCVRAHAMMGSGGAVVRWWWISDDQRSECV